jgi:cytochrome P450
MGIRDESDNRPGVNDAITYADRFARVGRMGVVELPRPYESAERTILLLRPEDMHVWTEQFESIDRSGHNWENLQLVFDHSVLFAAPSDDMWRHHHDVMFRQLSSRNVKLLPAAMERYTDNAMALLPDRHSFQLTGREITGLFKLVDLQAASESILGYSVNTQEVNDLMRAMSNLHTGSGVEVNAVWAHPKGFEVFNGLTNAGLSALRSFAGVVRDRVLRAPEVSPVVAEFIAREPEEHFGEEKTKYEILAILFGSLSTMSSSQMSMLHLLAKPENKIWQQSLQSGPAEDRVKLARAMLAESMRLYPAIYVHSRQVTHDFEFVDSASRTIRMNSGDKIVILPSLTHRLPDIWTDPEKFDPMRHMNKSSGMPMQQHAYIPFGFGPHVCIGAPATLIGGPIPVSRIAETFEIGITQSYTPEPEYDFTMSPNSGNVYTFARFQRNRSK